MADRGFDDGDDQESLRARSEQAIGELAQALLDSQVLENALAAAFGAREKAVEAQQAAMAALNLPSAGDVERLERRLRSLLAAPRRGRGPDRPGRLARSAELRRETAAPASEKPEKSRPNPQLEVESAASAARPARFAAASRGSSSPRLARPPLSATIRTAAAAIPSVAARARIATVCMSAAATPAGDRAGARRQPRRSWRRSRRSPSPPSSRAARRSGRGPADDRVADARRRRRLRRRPRRSPARRAAGCRAPARARAPRRCRPGPPAARRAWRGRRARSRRSARPSRSTGSSARGRPASAPSSPRDRGRGCSSSAARAAPARAAGPGPGSPTRIASAATEAVGRSRDGIVARP